MNRRDFMKGVGILLSFLGGWRGEKKSVTAPVEPTRPPLKVLHHDGYDRMHLDQNGFRVREMYRALVLSRSPQDDADRRWIRDTVYFPAEQGFVRKSVSVSENVTGTVWTWSIRDEEIPQPQRGV